MTTPEQQRDLYEWLGFPKPREKDGQWYYYDGSNGIVEFVKSCPPLYNSDGTYDANTWQHLAIPKLEGGDCLIGFTNCDMWGNLRHQWVISPGRVGQYCDPDPWAATAEWLGAHNR